MRIGLVSAREAKKWTQADLSEALEKKGIVRDRSTISHYESGDYDIPGRVLEALSDVLETPIAILLMKGERPEERVCA